MKRLTTRCSFTVLTATALTLATLAGSPAAADSATARLTLSASAAEIQPLADAERFVLKVALPDGSVEERGLASGETAVFSLFDRGGAVRPDGIYHYELIAVPRISDAVRATLAAARQSGDESALVALRANGQLPEPRVQSGSFRISSGSFVSTDAVEPRPTLATRGANTQDVPTRDQVIPDDLIVQGSVCVGFDCVNNESFGFDTIRLKENNTRIKFEDTSTGTFPSTDWQLTANDSASGGANKFSIEDITAARVPFTITGGATTNSIFVDSTGRVGLRTSTPVLDLHISTSNTPAIRLEQTNAGGFTAQTWDIAGNEANFFVRDVTSGSRLPFRIRPGAPTSSVDIAADGNVGIGTASPADKLEVELGGSTNGGVLIQQSGTGLPQLTLDNVSAAQIWRFRVNNADQFVFTDATNGKSPVVVFANANSNLLRVGGTNLDVADVDRVTVAGELFINGTVVTPDYVFESDYHLPSLDEQRAFITANKHLPAVGKAVQEADGTWSVNLGQQHAGVLEELEKAHLYILQLHGRLEELESTVAELKNSSTNSN